MPIYELTDDSIRKLEETSFAAQGVRERYDLQRLLRANIEIISPKTLVIAEEFGDWDSSQRRIDILGIDKNANLVVIELKRTDNGGHMELQAIRYAAMVSAMTFEKAVEVYGKYLRKMGDERDAEDSLMEFLDTNELDEDQFAQDVRIVLASAEFSKELTTSVMWLNDRDIDIRCVRLKPYHDNGRVLLDVQQVLPLQEAEEYRVQIKEKRQQERQKRSSTRDLTKFDVVIDELQYRQQPKRLMVLHMVRHLCKLGYSPDEVRAKLPFTRTNLFLSVDGEVGENEFWSMAVRQAEARGRNLEERRWFFKEDQLIHFNGRTYALTSGWGHRTLDAIDAWIEAFPDADIQYEAVE